MVKNFRGTIAGLIICIVLSFCAAGKVIYNYYNYVPLTINKTSRVDTDGIPGINLKMGDIEFIDGNLIVYDLKDKSSYVIKFERYIAKTNGDYEFYNYSGKRKEWKGSKLWQTY